MHLGIQRTQKGSRRNTWRSLQEAFRDMQRNTEKFRENSGRVSARATRMKGRRIMNFAIRFIALVIFSSNAFTADAAAPAMETSATGNSYVAGSSFRIASPVMADLLAAGGRISVENEVGADATIAGGTIEIRAPVRQDVRAAGGTIDVEANVGGDMVAAGGTVRLDNDASVAGSAWLAGSDIELAGKIGRGARVFAKQVRLSGQIDGNTRIHAQQIDLGPTARINGDLTYASPTPLAQEKASQISGKITREAMPQEWNAERKGQMAMVWLTPLFVLGMLAAGILLYLLFPGAVDGTQRAIREHPVRSILTGLALLFAVPPLAILLMATVIGIPVGLILLTLYPLLILLGYLCAAFFIGRRAADAMKQPAQLGTGRQALFLVLALVVLSLVGWIPFLGGLILTLLLVTGIGAWAVWMQSQYASRDNRVA